MLALMDRARWRVAVTRDDKAEDLLSSLLDAAGMIAVPVPVLIEGPPPEPQKLLQVARSLESFDWIICASARAVRAIHNARANDWPTGPRTAAVGTATAAAMRAAGASNPIVGSTYTARALWDTVQPRDAWASRRVLVTTIAGGRRDLIDGLRAAGADVTELQAYSMRPRRRDDIRDDWRVGAPDAVILGSADTARYLIDAVGVDALHELQAVVPIGPTTAQALADAGIIAEPPARATFAAAVDRLKLLCDTLSR